MARYSYTAEFKREAVRLASDPELSRRQAAKQKGIHPIVLASWMEKFKKGNRNEKRGTELRTEQTRQIERLKRELARTDHRTHPDLPRAQRPQLWRPADLARPGP